MSADVSRNARCGAADNRHTTGGAVPRPERIGDGHDRRARNCCRNGQFGRRGHPRRRRGRRRYRLGDRVPLHDRPTVARRHRDARFLGDRPGGPHRLRRTGGRSGRPPRSRRSSAFRRRPVRGGRHVPRRRGPRGHRVRPRRADADRRHPSDAVERPHGSSSRVRARTHRAAAGDPGVRGHRVPAMARIRTRPAGRRCRRRVRPGGRVARRLGDAHRRRGGLARADAAVRGRDRRAVRPSGHPARARRPHRKDTRIRPVRSGRPRGSDDVAAQLFRSQGGPVHRHRGRHPGRPARPRDGCTTRPLRTRRPRPGTTDHVPGPDPRSAALRRRRTRRRPPRAAHRWRWRDPPARRTRLLRTGNDRGRGAEPGAHGSPRRRASRRRRRGPRRRAGRPHGTGGDHAGQRLHRTTDAGVPVAPALHPQRHERPAPHRDHRGVRGSHRRARRRGSVPRNRRRSRSRTVHSPGIGGAARRERRDRRGPDRRRLADGDRDRRRQHRRKLDESRDGRGAWWVHRDGRRSDRAGAAAGRRIPAPFSEAAPAPTADNPAPGETPTQPVYTPPPAAGGGTAPAPVQGPSPAQIGTGFGNAAEGVGNGVGAVLNGVGGVVGGVVGAVVDPVTGLLIGK